MPAKAALRKGFDRIRRRLRWLVRPPRVRGSLPRMFPGALRMGEAEEEAAVAAVRELMRAKKLFRFYGFSSLERSRVARFERAFAAHVGARHALAVNSGTSALVCGLVALGVGPGDEVIVPAYTWFSSAGAVLAAGAVPVFAEVDESLTLDPKDAAGKLSPRTKALIPVHMRGAPAAMDEVMRIAADKSLLVLEDAAQAAGGSFRGRFLGAIGHAGAYSFQMSKMLTAGEGGLMVSNDPAVYRRAAMYHDTAVCPHFGVPIEEWLPGVNLRMSELHAAVLEVQLDRLSRLLADMRTRKATLKSRLAETFDRRGIRFRAVRDPAGDTAIALIFFLPEAERVEPVVAALADENVSASRLYHDLQQLPYDHVDLHALPAWTPILEKRTWSAEGGPWRWHSRDLEYSRDACPVTIDLLRRAVHIDVNPELDEQQLEQMAAAITEVVAAKV